MLEQIYEGATVRLAPNDEESATITFNTGLAQGSITSPQLFNIFINALLRMLTVTGQNEDISHGLQIGKDQKGDNQRDENGYQFFFFKFKSVYSGVTLARGVRNIKIGRHPVRSC